MHWPKNKWLKGCGFLSPGLLQLKLSQKLVTTNQSQSYIHFLALKRLLNLYFFKFWVLRCLQNWRGNSSLEVILKRPPCPPPTANLLRTCVSPGCKSGTQKYFMNIKYFIHFVMWQIRLWNGERSNVFGFSSRASEFHRSWFLRWYVIAITVRFLKCI